MPKPNTKNSNPQIINDLNQTSKSDLDKCSIISIVCRICYDGDKDESIIAPCKCKGTVAFVHRSCLETWLAESNTTSCELCHYVYKTERTPKYTARQSIWRWFRYQPVNIGFHIRGLRSDILACTILTPLAIVITYICLFSADYYNQKKYSHIPAAKWTSVSLLVLISIMLMGYYLWVYMVVRYHGRIWYYCWQRDCVVRYIAPNIRNTYCQYEVNNQEDVQFVPTSASAICERTNSSNDPSVPDDFSVSTTLQTTSASVLCEQTISNESEEHSQSNIIPGILQEITELNVALAVPSQNCIMNNQESVVTINDIAGNQ